MTNIETLKLALDWAKDATVVLSRTSSAIQGGIGAEAEGVGGCSVTVVTALRQAIEQAQQAVDWEKLYRLELKKKEAIAAKYEEDIKPLTKIVPMAQQAQPCGLECDCTDVCKQDNYKALWQQMCERCDELDKQLAQQAEPVAWWNSTKDSVSTDPVNRHNKDCQPLYTSPPPRQPLTDEEIFSVWRKHTDLDAVRYTPYEDDGLAFARAIEAAHGIKEKNHD